MAPHPSQLRRHALGLATGASLLALTGCGSGHHEPVETAAQARRACPQVVADDLMRVVKRVYHEGVSSERTRVAQRFIAASAPLRTAVERGDPLAASAAARALVATGRMTNLRVTVAGRVLADVGGPAVAPLSGLIAGSAGRPVAAYVTSVWSDRGLLAESQGLAQARIAFRVGERSVGGSMRLPPGRLPARGAITVGGVRYQYASFGADAYPSGRMRIYVLRTLASTTPLCGRTRTKTTVNTLGAIARLIYAGEAGRRTRPQVRRVERDPALLRAVAAHDVPAIKTAIDALLTQHIVRLRVRAADGSLLADVGGPYVLAPVGGTLRLAGRPIGTFLLSIQDDEGYLRLTGRLAGLKVLMYMGSSLVKNSLGPDPGTVPASGPYEYRGSGYEVVTLNVRAFPSGPLTIRVLIPIPYR